MIYLWTIDTQKKFPKIISVIVLIEYGTYEGNFFGTNDTVLLAAGVLGRFFGGDTT